MLKYKNSHLKPYIVYSPYGEYTIYAKTHVHVYIEYMYGVILNLYITNVSIIAINFANNISLLVRDAFANIFLLMQSSVGFANVFHCQRFALYGMDNYDNSV